MAKYKVLKTFRDKESGVVRNPQNDKEIELTVKRADEIEMNLKDKGFEGPFLERLDNKEDEADSKKDAETKDKDSNKKDKDSNEKDKEKVKGE